MAGAPITVVLLNAKDKFTGFVWSVTFHIMPGPASVEFAVSAIFRVNHRLFASSILGDEVPFHRVTLRVIVCGLDAVACNPDRSRLDSDIDFKSSSITREVAFAMLVHQLRCEFSVVD